MATGLRKLSQVPSHGAVIPRAATVVVQPPGAPTCKVTVADLAPAFNVKWFGAKGDGETNDQEAVQDAIDAAALVRGTVWFPDGDYVCPVLTHKSGVALQGQSDRARLVECFIKATGVVGEEIAFSAPADKGATTIAIPATGLTDKWLRISSAINANSPDAGRDQLGHVAEQESYLAEFVRVKLGEASTATLFGPTIFPYSNTPGSDTRAEFTTSVAREVTFHEGGRIRGLTMLGKNPLYNSHIQLDWCRDFRIEDCYIDANDQTSQNVRMNYCLDCEVVGGRLTGRRNSVPSGSTANPVILASCTNCRARGVYIYHGNQGVDTTYVVDDEDYRGGPSINCGAVDCWAFYCATEGFTSHWGTLGNVFTNCHVMGSPRGIRIRGRRDRVVNCNLVNGAGTEVGILIGNAATVDAYVAGNTVCGYLEGIQVQWETGGEAIVALQELLGISSCLIAQNRVYDCVDHAIFASNGYATANMVGPRIVDNEVSNTGSDPIRVNEYNSGAVIRGNRIHGVSSGRGGVAWSGNSRRLTIDDNHVYGVHTSGFALRGNSVAGLLVNATVFPDGDSTAELHIGPTHTDAAVLHTGIVRNNAAYRVPRGVGWQPFVDGCGNVAPTFEGRSQFGIYLDPTGRVLQAKAVDSTGVLSSTHILVLQGSADPEGSVTGSPGWIYSRTNGEVYIKTTGTGNTGWKAIATL